MELQDLRYFQEIAAAGSLSRAAARLSVSQPTLSRQLRKLESEVRTHLFYRNGRGVTLTDGGKRLLEVSANALDQLANVKGELHSGKLEEIGNVTIEIPSLISGAIAADLAILFSEHHPHAQLRILESTTGHQQESNNADRLDLAVLYSVRARHHGQLTPVLLEDLYLIESPRSGLTGAADLANLGGRPCLLPGADNVLRKVIDTACATEQVQLTPRCEIDSIAALKQMVERGSGFTILPFGAVSREVADGRLAARPFASENMRALLVFATPPNRPVTSLTRAVIRLLHATIERACAQGELSGQTRNLSTLGLPYSALAENCLVTAA